MNALFVLSNKHSILVIIFYIDYEYEVAFFVVRVLNFEWSCLLVLTYLLPSQNMFYTQKLLLILGKWLMGFLYAEW